MRLRLLLLAYCLLVAPLRAEPPEVEVVHPVEREVAPYADFTGRTQASTTVVLKPRISSEIVNVLVEASAQVQRGQALIQLDDREQKIGYSKSQAELERSLAHLKLAELEALRAQRLSKTGAISKEEVEKLTIGVEIARAEVALHKAEVERAKLSLSYTVITAPIDGHLELSEDIAPGNVVEAYGNSLGSIENVDPLVMTFELDDRTLLRIRNKDGEIGERPALPAVEIHLASEKGVLRGALEVGTRINPESGLIRARVALPNPKRDLRPGTLARVRIAVGPPRKKLLIPVRCAEDLDSPFISPNVLVVNSDNQVVAEFFDEGQVFGNLVEIERGLDAEAMILLHRGRNELLDKPVRPRLIKDLPDD